MARVRGIKQPHPLGSVASRAGVQQLTAASGGTISSGGVKISALPAASAANDIDQVEVNQAGTTRRITIDQITDHVRVAIDTTDGMVDLAALGILSDGTDKTALLNSIFATYGAAAYRLTKVGSGTMLTTGTVNMPNGGVLTMADDVVWEAHLISFQGSLGPTKNFTARTAPDAVAYSFDTSGIAVDDWVYVWGCTSLASTDAGDDQLTWPGDFGTAMHLWPGQFLLARTVTPTTMTAVGGARWAYEITPGPTTSERTISQAFKVNYITGGIRGGTIRAWSGATASRIIFIQWGYKVFIEGVNFDMFPKDLQQSINMQKSWACWVTGCTSRRQINGSQSTLREAVNVQSCQSIQISRNTIIGGNQPIDITVMVDGTATPSFDCSVTYNTIMSSFDGATSHPGSTNIRIDSNYIVDCERGIRIRTPRSSASYNTIINNWNQGVGIFLQQGWVDGTVVIGNIIEGFVQGISASYSSSGLPKPSTMIWTDNIIRNATYGLLIGNDKQDAITRSVVIRGGEVTGTMLLWTNFSPYINGLSIEGVTFSGTATGSPPGVITLPANTADVTIGTNYFRDTGAVPCIYGPGSSVISDLTVFPAGEAAAKWTIAGQLQFGTTTGSQSTNMPTNVAAYTNLNAFGRQLTTGQITTRSLAVQTEAPLQVQNAAGNLQMAVSGQGKILGPNADIALGILSTASTVPQVVAAVTQLLSLSPVTYRAAFNFMGSAMPAGATLTRASTGWYFNSTPALASAVVDVARFPYDPTTGVVRGLWNEPSAINMLPNASANGTVPGTPGTTPTTWSVTSTANNVTRTVVGSGTEDGIPYVDIRYAGTPSASGVSSVIFITATGITAAVGQTWTSSVYVRLMAGGLSNLTVDHRTTGRTAAGGTVETTILAFVPTAAPLRTQRLDLTRTLLTATSEKITGQVTFTYTSGNAIDATLRFGLPQLAQTSVAASPIVSTTVAVTRAADVLTLTVPNSTYDIDIIREAGVTTLPSVVVGAGTYVVPTDPSPLQKVVFR